MAFGGGFSGHDPLPLGQRGRAAFLEGLAIDEVTLEIYGHLEKCLLSKAIKIRFKDGEFAGEWIA